MHESVVVLRERDAQGLYTTQVWVGTSTYEVLRELNRFLGERAVLGTRWGRKQDLYIVNNYRVRSTRTLAQEMTKLFRRPFTHNAIISRYNKLKRRGDIERYRTDPTFAADRYEWAPRGSR